MKRVALAISTLVIVLTLATQVGAASSPRDFPVECLRNAVLKSDESNRPSVRRVLCGGRVIGKSFLGGGVCLYAWDGGPGLNRRITVWQSPC